MLFCFLPNYIRSISNQKYKKSKAANTGYRLAKLVSFVHDLIETEKGELKGDEKVDLSMAQQYMEKGGREVFETYLQVKMAMDRSAIQDYQWYFDFLENEAEEAIRVRVEVVANKVASYMTGEHENEDSKSAALLDLSEFFNLSFRKTWIHQWKDDPTNTVTNGNKILLQEICALDAKKGSRAKKEEAYAKSTEKLLQVFSTQPKLLREIMYYYFSKTDKKNEVINPFFGEVKEHFEREAKKVETHMAKKGDNYVSRRLKEHPYLHQHNKIEPYKNSEGRFYWQQPIFLSDDVHSEEGSEAGDDNNSGKSPGKKLLRSDKHQTVAHPKISDQPPETQDLVVSSKSSVSSSGDSSSSKSAGSKSDNDKQSNEEKQNSCDEKVMDEDDSASKEDSGSELDSPAKKKARLEEALKNQIASEKANKNNSAAEEEKSTKSAEKKNGNSKAE